MKSSKNIVFVGMMGSGKSTIGLLLSKKLKKSFFDVDTYIEKELGKKISILFKEKGEKFFREYEEKITLKILEKKNIIIAMGGGAFLNKNIRSEVLKNHLSFWLKWNSEILINRIKKNPKRPIAFNSTKNELIDMIKKRSNFYSKAMYKINCNNYTKTEIIRKILKIYEDNKIKN
tara:strand:+ start:239 stop:763 length:525 start_codon:yes stop_codon:yes gene_type:complete